MATRPDDNLIRQNDKARWGFSGSASEVKVGEQTVGETGDVETVNYQSSEEGARNNGGGEEAPKRTRSKKAADEE